MKKTNAEKVRTLQIRKSTVARLSTTQLAVVVGGDTGSGGYGNCGNKSYEPNCERK